jgi:hypothetical protein
MKEDVELLKIKNTHELLLMDKKYKFALRMTTIISSTVLVLVICIGLYFGIQNMLNLVMSAIFFASLTIVASTLTKTFGMTA